jgi:ankyrin repeat protein
MEETPSGPSPWSQVAIDDMISALSSCDCNFTPALERVQIALGRGFPVNAKTTLYPRGTLLHALVWRCYDADTVLYLIQHGANVLACDCHGQTPGHLAAVRGLLGVCRALGSKSIAWVDDRLPKGYTPLESALATTRPDLEVVTWLAQHSCNDTLRAAACTFKPQPYQPQPYLVASLAVIKEELARRARWSPLRAAWVAAAVTTKPHNDAGVCGRHDP